MEALTSGSTETASEHEVRNYRWQALLTDYAEARSDERMFLSLQTATLTLGVTVVSGMLAFLAKVEERAQNSCLTPLLCWTPPPKQQQSYQQQFHDLIIAAAPLVPAVVAAFALWLGSMATVRGFYMRALEREIRLVGGMEGVDLRSYEGIKVVSLYEMLVEHNGFSSLKARPSTMLLNIVTSSLLIVTAIISWRLFSFMSSDILWWTCVTLYGTFTATTLWWIWKMTIEGRKYVLDLVKPYRKRLTERLDSLRRNKYAEASIARIALPRVDELVKGAFFVVGYMLGCYVRPFETGWKHALLVGCTTYFVVEVLAYQGRYLINDLLGKKEDSESPTKESRGRLSENDRPAAIVSIPVRITLITAAGLSLRYTFPEEIGYRLLFISGLVYLIMLPYELVRNWVRENPNVSSRVRTKYFWRLMLLVSLGYPLRLAGGAWLALGSADMTLLVPLAVMASGLGWVFVGPTWVLEAFSYVTFKHSTDRIFYADRGLLNKYHLLEVAKLGGWDIRILDPSKRLPLNELDGRNYRALSAQAPKGVKVWLLGCTIYLIGLAHLVKLSNLFECDTSFGHLLLLCGTSLVACLQFGWRGFGGLFVSVTLFVLITAWPIGMSAPASWFLFVGGLAVPVLLALAFSGQSYEDTRSVASRLADIARSACKQAVAGVIGGCFYLWNGCWLQKKDSR